MAPPRPKAVLFDVNQTLFSLDPVGERMRAAGLKGEKDLQLWFAMVLRDGIAATAAGKFAAFKDIGAFHLRQMLAAQGVSADTAESTAQHILGAFLEAPPMPDAGPALEQLHAAGIKVTAMTNGTAEIANGVLEKAGVRHLVDSVMDVTQCSAWKPAPEAYHFAVVQPGFGFQPEEVMLVAVHPWDINGAKAAGLQAAFVARNGEQYPPFFEQPDMTVASLTELAQRLKSMN